MPVIEPGFIPVIGLVADTDVCITLEEIGTALHVALAMSTLASSEYQTL
jgi:hypothetical protein